MNNSVTSRPSGTTANNLRKTSNNQFVQQPVAATSNRQITGLIIGLVIIVILWVLGNYIYTYYTANQKSKVVQSVILSSPHNGQSEFDIGGSQLANSGYSNEYAISFWLYVDDYSYKQGLRKYIMRRGNIKTGVNPEVYLDASVNTLHVNVSMMGNSPVGQLMGPESKPTTTSTTASTAASTVASTTAITTSGGATEDFTDMNSTINTDSAASPGLIANPMQLLGKLNSNAAHIPDIYDNSYFSLVSGNEVGSINQSGVNFRHNSELNVVLEQFGNDNTKDCECPDTNGSSDENEKDRKEFEAKAGKCMVQSFPLQKWVHVVISQYNQVLDIYIDGKLSSSCVLPGFPDVINDDLILGPDDGFSGKITKVTYINSSVSADDVYSMYVDGPDSYDNILSRVPNWAWGVLALIVLAVVIYSFQ